MILNIIKYRILKDMIFNTCEKILLYYISYYLKITKTM